MQSLKTGARKTIVEGATDARFVPTGHIVYAVAGTLFAVPFDLGKLAATGGAVPIVEGVGRVTAVTKRSRTLCVFQVGLSRIRGGSGVGGAAEYDVVRSQGGLGGAEASAGVVYVPARLS